MIQTSSTSRNRDSIYFTALFHASSSSSESSLLFSDWSRSHMSSLLSSLLYPLTINLDLWQWILIFNSIWNVKNNGFMCSLLSDPPEWKPGTKWRNTLRVFLLDITENKQLKLRVWSDMIVIKLTSMLVYGLGGRSG